MKNNKRPNLSSLIKLNGEVVALIREFDSMIRLRGNRGMMFCYERIVRRTKIVSSLAEQIKFIHPYDMESWVNGLRDSAEKFRQAYISVDGFLHARRDLLKRVFHMACLTEVLRRRKTRPFWLKDGEIWTIDKPTRRFFESIMDLYAIYPSSRANTGPDVRAVCENVINGAFAWSLGRGYRARLAMDRLCRVTYRIMDSVTQKITWTTFSRPAIAVFPTMFIKLPKENTKDHAE